VLVNFIVVLVNQCVDVFLYLLDLRCRTCLLGLGLQCVPRHCCSLSNNTTLLLTLLVLDFGLDTLLLVQVALQESVVQVDLGQ
jgi:hypothetical protein